MMDELERLVAAMEGGELPLSEMLRQYAAGVSLLASCREKLAQAERTLTTAEETIE